MILDSKLVFANNVSAVADNAAVSTNVNVLDTGAATYVQLANTANPDIGTGKEIWVKCVATVGFTTNMDTQFVLYHGAANNTANTAFTGPLKDVNPFDATNFATATDAQKVIYDGPIPADLQRWIKGTVLNTGNVAAGAFDCYLYVK